MRTLLGVVRFTLQQFSRADVEITVVSVTSEVSPYLSSKCNSSWSNEQLTIPNVTPSIANCSILRVVYFVKVSLRIPGSMKLATVLPVTLGSNVGLGYMLMPPPYSSAAELPSYDYNSTSDEDEDYPHPPNSRAQTPPPCYSDIFDSDSEDDEALDEAAAPAVTEADVVTTL
ncbi:hypothetical protein EB796_004547 [Bugula neritina]|uniref:Arrestin C-terminal-like domain-containing protein n=1 Tax=Bugula neritina TaxID=10212 RepID=A0A7J7KES4_BUGNE|nr:hypothetical protein EB796_004547 [Bugula neritina]